MDNLADRPVNVSDEYGQSVEISIIKQHVQTLGLKMKPVKVEFQGEGKEQKFFIYFTANKRVDFRELVKRLYLRYHCRIEMRQISLREHAQMIGAGINTCPHSVIPCFIPWCQTSRFGGCFYDKELPEQKYTYNDDELNV